MAKPARTVTRPSQRLDFGVRNVELMFTTGCNLQCAYCYQKRRAPRTMAPEVLDAAIRHLVSSRLDRPGLTLYGGEPLLAAPLVRRALERVRHWAPARMRPDVQIVTNGTLLDAEMAHLLASHDVFITLSSDGVAPAQDDRSPGSFERLDRLLVRLRRDHPGHFRKRLAVKVTLTSRNVPFLAASFRYFLSRGVRDVDIYPVLPDDAGWNARSRRELGRQLAKVVELSVQEFRRSGQVPFGVFRGAAEEPPAAGAPACGCGSRGLLFVDVDGALAPCSLLVPSTLGSQPRPIRRAVATLGGVHVTDPDLPAALMRRENRAHRLRFLAGPENRQGPCGTCARCKARPTCFVCPIAVACNGGRVPAFHCDVNRLFGRHRAAFLVRRLRISARGNGKSLGRRSIKNPTPDCADQEQVSHPGTSSESLR
jgi:sulfatase maturation enzyme AslB (radical SAM superfamily)